MKNFDTILVAFAALAFAAGVAAHPGEVEVAKVSAAARGVAEDLTFALLDANSSYTAADPGDRGLRLGELIKAARDRHDALAALINSDPEEVLKVALPASVRASFPGEAAPFLEQDAQEDGTLEVYHVDSVHPADNHYLYVLNTTKGKLSLNFAGKQPAFLTGAKVRVTGLKIDNALALNSGSSVTTLAAAPLPNTLGAQKTLTMLVNFTDEQTQPYSVADAQAIMFTTTSDYDYEASYQQTWLTGDVAGWFTIPVSSTTCDYSSIGTYANQAASKAGFNLSNYTHYVYVFPANACSWWGLGTVGGNPSQAWIHSQWGFTLPVVGHEMGHNFGLYHSHSLDCGNVEVADSGCSASEYGDIFDIMGSSNTTPHFNAFQKERLGWLNAGVSPPLTTITSGSGTYTIAPMEMGRNTTSRALKIAKTTSCTSTQQQWYYVESRQAQGYDAFLSGYTNVLSGVLVHEGTDGDPNSGYLLDMTPATDSWYDAALDAGSTFTDTATGLTITPTSVTSSGTIVSVTAPATSCTHAAPAIALTPTGTQYTSAGATASYTVSVTNNDGCGCAASTFDVSAVVPAGWGATNPRTASITPGATGTTSLSITSASSATAAFYTVPSTAANSAAPAFAATASGTIAIISSLVDSVTTDNSSYTRPTKGNQTVNAMITTSVTSGGGPLSGASVSVQVTDPRGSTTTLSGTTNSGGTVTFSYSIKMKAVTGNYTVNSRATLGSMSATKSTGFSVQ